MPIENFAGKAISDTYQRVVQTDGTYLADGTGSILNNLTLPGNLIVSGTLYAQNTVVVTQSFSSGSNILGDAVDDFQTLYGNVRIPTGSLTVTGSTIISSSAQTQLQVGNNLLFVSSSGNIGIGVTSSIYRMDVNGSTRVQTDNNAGILLTSQGNSNPMITFSDGRGFAQYAHIKFYDLTFRTDSTVVAKFFDTGNFGINTTADAGFKLNVNGTGRFSGNLTITGSLTNSLLVKGSGTTSATTTLLVQDANASSSLEVKDDKSVTVSGILTANSSSTIAGPLTVNFGGVVGGTALYINGNTVHNGGRGISTTGYAYGIQSSHTMTNNWNNNPQAAGVFGSGDIGLNGSGNIIGVTANSAFFTSLTGLSRINAKSSTTVLQVRGTGTTSSTTSLLVQNANASSSLTVLDNGYVGINTGSAQYNLDVDGTLRVTGISTLGQTIINGGTQTTSYIDITATLPAFRLWSADYSTLYGGLGSSAWAGSTGNDPAILAGAGLGIKFLVNGGSTPNMTVASNGNVGIGTTSPTSKLTIKGGSANWNETTPGTTAGTIHLNPTTGGANYGNAITFGAWDYDSGTTAQAGIYVRSDGAYGTKIYFATTDSYTAGSKTRLYIGADGNVGINTINPLTKFQVSGTAIISNPAGSGYNENLRLPQANSGYAALCIGGAIAASGTTTEQWTFVKYPTSNDFSLRNSSTDYFYFTQGGLLGIGTQSPSAKLTVKGSGTTSATTAVNVQDASGNNSLQVTDDNVTRVGRTSAYSNATTALIVGHKTSNQYGTQLVLEPNKDDNTYYKLVLEANYSGANPFTLYSSGNQTWLYGYGNPMFAQGPGMKIPNQISMGTTDIGKSEISGSVLFIHGADYYARQAYVRMTSYTTGVDTLRGAAMGLWTGDKLRLWNYENTSIDLGVNNIQQIQITTGSTTVYNALLGEVEALPTASGTASMDCSKGNFFTLTLSGSYTLFLSASNIQPGQTINLRVTQPATSGSLTYGSTFKFAGGIPYTASSTASVVDLMTFISFDSSTLYASALKNLS